MEPSPSAISEPLSAATSHVLSFSAKLLPRQSLSLPALDAAAPPTAVRTYLFRHSPAPTALARRSMRRTRRRRLTEDDGFSGDGDGDDGPFGGGGDAGCGGKGWGSGDDGPFGGGGDAGCGGKGWGSGDPEPGWDGSSLDPAFDFIYGVLCWIALSNCTHFAFKKMGRLLATRGPSVC